MPEPHRNRSAKEDLPTRASRWVEGADVTEWACQARPRDKVSGVASLHLVLFAFDELDLALTTADGAILRFLMLPLLCSVAVGESLAVS